MSIFLKRNKLTLLGILFGAIAGYFYWLQVGCSSGTCPITSSPVWSSLYGALLGGLLFSIFKKEEKQKI
jgi:hypothetical protein